MAKDLNATLQEWATKSGKPIAELTAAYQKKFAELPASVPQGQKEKRALQLLKSELESSMRSPAVAFEGVVLGAFDVMDMMKKMRENQMNTYNQNPQAAIQAGLARMEADGKVTLLDARKELGGKPNNGFGKPLQLNAFARRLVVALRKPGETSFVAGKMTLRGDLAKTVPPIGQLLEFRAIDGKASDNTYDIKSGQPTQFKVVRPLTNEEVIQLVDSVYGNKVVLLGDCEKFHANIPEGNYDAFVVTEGTISFMKKIESEAARSDMIVISDETLDFGADGVTCWVPKELRPYITFGTGSLCTIIAKTAMGPGYDRNTKQQTTEQRLMLNVAGIFPRPGFATPANDSG